MTDNWNTRNSLKHNILPHDNNFPVKSINFAAYIPNNKGVSKLINLTTSTNINNEKQTISLNFAQDL